MSTRFPPLGAEMRAVLLLGLPLIGSNLAQIALGVTDTLMMGRYGVEELAALVLASSAFFVFFIVGSGFGIAVMPLAANALGAGDRRQMRRVVRMGLWLSVAYCAAVMPVLFPFRALMVALGQEPRVAALAQDYMRIAQWGMFPAMLIMVLRSHLSALERPGWVLWATIIGALVNALADWVLIFGRFGAPEMGVRGAAWASVLTQLVTFAVIAGHVAWAPAIRDLRIFHRLWRPDWPALVEVFRLGWPIGGTLLAEVGLFSAAAVMMGWIGTLELAAHGIAIQIASISFMVYLGLAMAGTVRAGLALGRGDWAGVDRTLLAVVLWQMGTAAVVILLFLLVPEQLFRLFLDPAAPDSPAVVAYGVGLLAIAALFQVVDGLQVVLLSILRGVKDTKVPMLCAVASYWGAGLTVAWVLGFPLGLGGRGVWAGLAIGLGLAALSLWLRYRWLRRRAGAGGALVPRPSREG